MFKLEQILGFRRDPVSVSVSGLNGPCSGYGVTFIIIGWSSSCVWWKTVPIELWQVNSIQFLPAASDRRRGHSQQMLETQARDSWETIHWMDWRASCLRLTFAVTAENNGTIKSCNNVTRWVHLVILNNFRWECQNPKEKSRVPVWPTEYVNCKNRKEGLPLRPRAVGMDLEIRKISISFKLKSIIHLKCASVWSFPAARLSQSSQSLFVCLG